MTDKALAPEMAVEPSPQPMPSADTGPATGPDALSEVELLDAFESMGDNCEFGWFQKVGGIDRLALFKWSSAPLSILADLITRGLPGVDDKQYLRLRPEPRDNGNAEYLLEHSLLHTPMHTFVLVGSVPEAVALDRVARRMTLLSRKFLQDAKEAKRIYVYRNPAAPCVSDVMRVHEALCTHGPNRMLYVHLPTPDLAAGEIRIHHPGFAEAAIDQLTPYEAATTILTTMWPDILRKAYAALPRDAVAESFRVAETCS